MGSLDEVVFLLGAGALADAGTPVVASLTRQLRELLPNLRDVNGNRRHDFGEVFDSLLHGTRKWRETMRDSFSVLGWFWMVLTTYSV